MLVQNRILTAEPLRALRVYFFVWQGDIAKQKPVLAEGSAFLGPSAVWKYLVSVPAGRRFLIPSPSPACADEAATARRRPDGIRKNPHSALSATQR